jgi:hypothetical protein
MLELRNIDLTADPLAARYVKEEIVASNSPARPAS